MLLSQERSSAKRKELFRSIQMRSDDGIAPKQLILDMTVRWSSTYIMLHCAYSLRDVCVFLFTLYSIHIPDYVVTDRRYLCV